MCRLGGLSRSGFRVKCFVNVNANVHVRIMARVVIMLMVWG